MGPERSERRGRPSRERFAGQPTELPYARLRAEPGISVEMDLATLARLLQLAGDYHQADRQAKTIGAEQEVRHKEIEGIAQTHPGFRGIIDEKNRIVLTIFPQERDVQFDEFLLREGLGLFFGDVVRKRFRADIPYTLR